MILCLSLVNRDNFWSVKEIQKRTSLLILKNKEIISAQNEKTETKLGLKSNNKQKYKNKI